MMKRFLISAVALFLATSAVWAQNNNLKPAMATPTPVDCSSTTDAQITDNVKAKLAATPSLKGETIEVATSAGVVTLTGKVKTSSSKGLLPDHKKRRPGRRPKKCEAEVKSALPKRTRAPSQKTPCI
jgi:hypothetical protein